MAPPLLTMGASLVVIGPEGETTIPLNDFFRGVKKTGLVPGQWVKGISIPPQPPQLQTSFMKKSRIRGHDLAGVNVGGLYDPDTRQLRLAVGACAPTPLLYDLTDAWSEARDVNSFVGPAVDQVVDGLLAICDNRASDRYRQAMVRLFTERSLRQLLHRA